MPWRALLQTGQLWDAARLPPWLLPPWDLPGVSPLWGVTMQPKRQLLEPRVSNSENPAQEPRGVRDHLLLVHPKIVQSFIPVKK